MLTIIVVFAGVMLTGMLAMVINVLMSREAVTAHLVVERTARLRESEEKAHAVASEAEVARQEAEIANLAKSEFLATMSHEIRTPLNGVLGMAQLLSQSRLDEAQQMKVKTILSSGQSLLAIISDVLDMSKIEAGSVELEETAFDLSDLMSMILTPFQSMASDKGIELKASNDFGELSSLRGDPVRLRQIIWNLLSNAIKFTDQGQISVTISEDSRPEFLNGKDRALCLVVEDTGTGIEADRIDAIFDPFTQADTSITRKFGGTGLGLSIVYRLIELMGGTITLSSEFGRGSRFEVHLPFDEASKEEANLLAAKLDTSMPTPVKCLDIVLAEDNVVNSMIAEAFLQHFGHTVRLAFNGIEAVEAYRQKTPDAIFMDIHMPEMDGVEATKAIRNLDANVPIIGLTAEAFQEHHQEFMLAGMSKVITKPFTEDQLRIVLDDLTRQSISH